VAAASSSGSAEAGPGLAARRDNFVGLAQVACAACLWATIPLVLRAADGASIVKVFWRVAIAFLGVFIWVAARGRLGEIATLPRRRMLAIAGQGALLALNWVLFLTALDTTNVATAELLGYTGPVIVAALAPRVSGEPFDRRVVLPLALSLAGIVVILAPQGLSLASPTEMAGAGLAFCSSLTYATLMLRSKRLLHGISASTLMLGEYAAATVLLLPALFFLPGPSTAKGHVALVVLGLVQTAFAVVLFLTGLRRVRTDHAAVITYLEPVGAVVLAAAFLGEALTAYAILGGAMVVAGGVIVARLEPVFGPETADAGSESEGVPD
jgi:drug/metabolite transporter (DMT)-like permease